MENPTQHGSAYPALTVTIQLGNVACSDLWDALQILESEVRRINDGDAVADIAFHRGEVSSQRWNVRDENGNTVGEIIGDHMPAEIVNGRTLAEFVDAVRVGAPDILRVEALPYWRNGDTPAECADDWASLEMRYDTTAAADWDADQ